MTRILLVDTLIDDLSQMKSAMDGEGYTVFTALDSCEALNFLNSEEINIVVISLDVTEPSWQDLAVEFRQKYFQRPLQVIITAQKKKRLNEALEGGADDYIQKPVGKLEFQTRIKAAQIRLRGQEHLYEEREFYRQAVKQEEELSNKILDRHLHLKHTLETVESEKEKLERTKVELEHIAKYDMLSGLLNRMSLFAIIDIEIERAMRTDTPLSGIMLDIDHFKNINDNFGHPVGDRVIREIGIRLQGTLRKYDHAGRYGGEEFFLVLPNTFKDQAFIIAERFRIAIAETAVEAEGVTVSFTASLGVAQYQKTDTRERWIARADSAMYRAKAEGRNTSCVE